MPALIMSLRGKPHHHFRGKHYKQHTTSTSTSTSTNQVQKYTRDHEHEHNKKRQAEEQRPKKSVRFDLFPQVHSTDVRADADAYRRSEIKTPYEESRPALAPSSSDHSLSSSSASRRSFEPEPEPVIMSTPQGAASFISSTGASDDNDNDNDNGSGMSTGKKVMWGFLIGAGLLVVMFLVASFRNRHAHTDKEHHNEEIADWGGTDLDLEEAQMEEYLNRGAMLRKRYQELGARRVQVLQMMEQNKSEAERNSEQFKTLFAQHKSSFDDDIADQEEEQRLDTAFMLKTDLDEKKSGMIKRGEMLGKQMQAMRAEIQKVDAELKQLVEYYNNTYAQAAIPLGADGVPAIHETSLEDSSNGTARGVHWRRPTSEVRVYDPRDPPRSVSEQQLGRDDNSWAALDRAGAKLGQYPDGVPRGAAEQNRLQQQRLQAQLAHAESQKAAIHNVDSMDGTGRAIAKAMSDYGQARTKTKTQTKTKTKTKTKPADFPEEFPRDGTGRALIPN